MIHDTQDAQISQRQDDHNMYEDTGTYKHLILI